MFMKKAICKYHRLLYICISNSPSVVEYSCGGGGDDDDVIEMPESLDEIEFETSSMVNFLIANRSKLMQLCMNDDRTLSLCAFDIIFQSLLEKDIVTATSKSMRITALLLDILEANNTIN